MDIIKTIYIDDRIVLRRLLRDISHVIILGPLSVYYSNTITSIHLSIYYYITILILTMIYTIISDTFRYYYVSRNGKIKTNYTYPLYLYLNIWLMHILSLTWLRYIFFIWFTFVMAKYPFRLSKPISLWYTIIFGIPLSIPIMFNGYLILITLYINLILDMLTIICSYIQPSPCSKYVEFYYYSLNKLDEKIVNKLYYILTILKLKYYKLSINIKSSL
jgi:hypothetical protein